MDLDTATKLLSLVTATGAASYAAISAGINWREKTVESRRLRAERRQAEVNRLREEFRAEEATFTDLFDYDSELDEHIRITNLTFDPAQVMTRSRADRAFEHLRDLHRSVTLGLIDRSDLGQWIYWIHRVDTRPVLAAYANACGYSVFVRPLQEWTSTSPELAALQACPWWTSTAPPTPQKRKPERSAPVSRAELSE